MRKRSFKGRVKIGVGHVLLRALMLKEHCQRNVTLTLSAVEPVVTRGRRKAVTQLLAPIGALKRCEISDRTVLAHVIGAGLAATTIGVAQAFAGPGTSLLLKVAGIVVTGGLAVGVIVWVWRTHQQASTLLELKAFVLSTAGASAANDPELPAARLITLMTSPHDLKKLSPRSLGQRAAQHAVNGLAEELLTRPLLLVPGLGGALGVAGACRDGLRSAVFVQQCALAANSLCAVAG